MKSLRNLLAGAALFLSGASAQEAGNGQLASSDRAENPGLSAQAACREGVEYAGLTLYDVNAAFNEAQAFTAMIIKDGSNDGQGRRVPDSMMALFNVVDCINGERHVSAGNAMNRLDLGELAANHIPAAYQVMLSRTSRETWREAFAALNASICTADEARYVAQELAGGRSARTKGSCPLPQ